MRLSRISPCRWFDSQVEEAARYIAALQRASEGKTPTGKPA